MLAYDSVGHDFFLNRNCPLSGCWWNYCNYGNSTFFV